MTDTQLRCAGCEHRFGRKSRSIVLVATYALCVPCSTDLDVHATLFINCTQNHAPTAHTALDDGPPALVTRGRAAQILKSSPPEGIIAS
jgi:hypothetical protein